MTDQEIVDIAGQPCRPLRVIDPGNNIHRLCDVTGISRSMEREWIVTDFVRSDPVGGLLYRLKNTLTGRTMLCSIQSMTNLY